MKNLKLTSLICGSVLSLAGSSLLAQQSATTDPNASSSSSSSQSSSTLGQSSSSSLGGVGASATTRGSMHSSSNVRLSEIMNKPVQSKEGKTLGYIRDLTVNPQSGQVEFAVLSLSSAGAAIGTSGAATDTSTSGRETAPSSRSSVSGTPGSVTGSTTMGKLIPVPWQLFSQSWSSSGHSTADATSSSSVAGTTGSGAAGNLTLNIDDSKLRSAPSFDSSNWNQLQGGTFDQRVYSYFGVDRSSATGTPGSSIRGQGTSGSYDPASPRSSSSPSTSPQGTSETQDPNTSASPDRSTTSPSPDK